MNKSSKVNRKVSPPLASTVNPNSRKMESSAAAAASGGNGVTISSRSNDSSPSPATPMEEASSSSSSSKQQQQNLEQVIESIQNTLGLLHQLYLTVSSFNSAAQLPLLQRLNTLVLELDNMMKLSEKCNIQVPMEVLNLIDEGKNPDEFTRDVLNSCIANNQITKGRTDAFKGFRRSHLEELEQAFPDEVETYREIRAASAAETKRLAQAQSILPNGDVKVKAEI
ncbi:hypothetical protein LguiA_034456 [Lonicera macranthoides]